MTETQEQNIVTIRQWLDESTTQLTQAGIDTSRLDSLVLLSDEIRRDKSWVLAHPEYILQGSQINILNTNIAQRAQHTPLAYIRGKVEFYGREFVVNDHVLVPRPESESIIELLKAIQNTEKETTVVDIGTGSGILAITAKLELPAFDIIATDMSKNCLSIAKTNADKLGANIAFIAGDLLEPLIHSSTKTPSILLCNLPYVPNDRPINRAASHEPAEAIFSGQDGLDHYRALCAQLTQLETKPTYIITESMETEHGSLTELMDTAGYRQRDSDGLAQCFSLISAR